MIKVLLAILILCSISLCASAIPWQCAAEKLKIKSIQCVQITSRVTARAVSIETPLEKLRVAGALVFIGGFLYGMLVTPDKFFGHNAKEEKSKKNYEYYPKIKPRTLPFFGMQLNGTIRKIIIQNH